MMKISLKSINPQIKNNIKYISIMTLIIFSILIILPLTVLSYDEEDINVFNLDSKNIVEDSKTYFPYNGKVKIYIKEENKVEEMDLEEYIIGVVASEMPADFDEEALKAQAIAARTFYMNRRNNNCKDAKNKGAEICNTTNCQVYMNKQKTMDKWSKSKAEAYWNKIKKAVTDTKGKILTYENVLIEYPQFFAVSSGKTEDAEDIFSMAVPYLKSQVSEGEEVAPKYKTSMEISTDKFISTIESKYTNVNIKKNNLESEINIESYNESGSVKEIRIDNQKIKGTEFREMFGLNSTNFKIDFNERNIKINCTGYGHGVGMSQWGANIMAKNGYSYDEILKHYYSGVEIQEIKYTP